MAKSVYIIKFTNYPSRNNLHRVSKNFTYLILTNFYQFGTDLINLLHIALVRFFYESQLYFLTEHPVYLLYLAISHSGVNDVLPLGHLFHSVIDKAVCCVHVLEPSF